MSKPKSSKQQSGSFYWQDL